MAAPARTMSDSSQHSDTLRKRVGKACDRCRLKKSKCDGSSPCTRCIADNSICVFGERRKAHDKVYPKGYVEMLEQQQAQLVAGLQETYHRLLAANLWPGPALNEREGHPLTHDILDTLNIIHHKSDGSVDIFEEDPEKMQRNLFANGASVMQRRGSVSSDSDHSVTHSHKRPRSIVDSPVASPMSTTYKKSTDMDRPVRSSAAPSMHVSQSRAVHKPSPLHTESPVADTFNTIEEDVLMASFPWQDMPNEELPTSQPHFTFPPNGNASFMMDPWPDQTNSMSPWMSFGPGLNTNIAYTNMQQLQKQPIEADPTGFVPVVS